MPVTSTSHPLHRRSEVEAAQNASSAFFNLAGQYFSSLPPDINLAARYNYDHRSELIAAATNLALSIELSLKALSMATGGKVIKTHNLLDLFEALPKKVNASVEAVYMELAKQIPPHVPAATIVYVTNCPIPPNDQQAKEALAKYPNGTDIRSVLKAEKDAFVNWRYFYEIGGQGNVTCLKAEHIRMCVIKNALFAHFGDGKTKYVIPTTPSPFL